MLKKPFLGRLIVIRSDNESCIRACGPGMLCQLNRLGSAVGTRACNNGHASMHRVNGSLHDHFVFCMVKCGGFPCSTTGNDCVRTVFQLKFDEIAQTLFIHLPIPERRNYGNNSTSNHNILPEFLNVSSPSRNLFLFVLTDRLFRQPSLIDHTCIPFKKQINITSV